MTDTKVEQQVKIQKRNMAICFKIINYFTYDGIAKSHFMTPMSQHITQLMQLNISDLVKQYPATLSGGEGKGWH